MFSHKRLNSYDVKIFWKKIDIKDHFPFQESAFILNNVYIGDYFILKQGFYRFRINYGYKFFEHSCVDIDLGKKECQKFIDELLKDGEFDRKGF